LEALFVFAFYALVDGLLATLKWIFENCSEGGASVFGIKVDASTENGLMADERSCKIEAAFDGQVCASFKKLREDFSEDGLLGEVFRTNDNALFAMAVAGGEKRHQKEWDHEFRNNLHAALEYRA
jgi:hypothetical protein